MIKTAVCFVFIQKNLRHKDKKESTHIFTCTDVVQQKNDELLHRFHPIAHGFNLKINTNLGLITPVLACIENSNSWLGI